jgi:hypothetical protein
VLTKYEKKNMWSADNRRDGKVIFYSAEME